MNTFSKATQFIAWFIILGLTKPFFKIEIKNRQNLIGVKPPAIFVSNHIRFYDSFLYRIAVGLFSPLAPIRFMGVKKFHNPILNFMYTIGVIPLVYALMGVVVVITGQGTSKNLAGAKKALNKGAVIGMFPEGKMFYDDTVGPFKWGAVILAEEALVPIMPFAIRKHGNRLIINVGKLYEIDKTKGPTENTELMRDIVVDLFNEIEF